MKKKLKICLVMPYFERPNMFLNAVNSFKRIKYDNWEIRIVDDGSVKHPVENILKNNLSKDLLKNIFVYNTNDTIENKIKRGSIHGKFINKALADSDADIFAMMCDDDAIHHDYFSNLNNFYSNNENVKYAYSHIIPFDPFKQVPCETLKKYNRNKYGWNTGATTMLNHTHPLNPFCMVDSTQVSWRSECNKIDGIWLPEEQTKNLDAAFYQQMFSKFGNCVYTGFVSVYKGFHQDQLGNRNDRKQFEPADLNFKPKYLSICSNFRDEADYLKEWIEYHINIGVDHFYLYNNYSTDTYKEVLKPFYDKGYITLKNVNKNPPKNTAYFNCIEEHMFESKWIAFLDCDEFIVVNEDKNVKDLLVEFEDYAAIGANWKMFGDSGFKKQQTGRVIDTFKKYNDPFDFSKNNVSCHIKTIANPRKISGGGNPHWFHYNNELCYPNKPLAVDENFNYIDGTARKIGGEPYQFAGTNKPSFNKIQINHYWCKSLEEYLNKKMARPRDDLGIPREKESAIIEYEEYNSYANILEEDNILKCEKRSKNE